jgi:hypothetical protein
MTLGVSAFVRAPLGSGSPGPAPPLAGQTVMVCR